MPTSRPRHTLTETDELRNLLDRAREFFPDVGSPAGLLHALLALGGEELARREAEAAQREATHGEQLEYLVGLSTGRIDGLDREALRAVRHNEYE